MISRDFSTGKSIFGRFTQSAKNRTSHIITITLDKVDNFKFAVLVFMFILINVFYANYRN